MMGPGKSGEHADPDDDNQQEQAALEDRTAIAGRKTDERARARMRHQKIRVRQPGPEIERPTIERNRLAVERVTACVVERDKPVVLADDMVVPVKGRRTQKQQERPVGTTQVTSQKRRRA